MAAAAGRNHRRHEAFHHVDRAHQIDFDTATPMLMLEVFDRAPNRNSGDVHQYVETPVRLMDVVCKCLYRRKVGNVERALQMDLRTEFTRLSCASFKRSEEHTSELQSLMRISYAVFCLKKKQQQ